MIEKLPHDQYADEVVQALFKVDAPYPVRVFADKVFRPALGVIDEMQADNMNAQHVAEGIEVMVAMVVANFVNRLAAGDMEKFADAAQEIMDNVAQRIHDDMAHRFKPKESNVVQLPIKG